MQELLTARVVLAVCIAVYYWCWARNGWSNYFVSIQNCAAIFAVLFFCFLSARERKYKKEIVDEMAAANFKRCDSICYKVTTALMIIAAFLSAVLRFTVSTEIIGYLLMGIFVVMTVLREILFCTMDAKGV